MELSNQFGVKRFNLRQVIDRAFRLCKLLPEQITSEKQDIARDVLFLVLQHLPNKGLLTSTIKRKILGLQVGQPIVDLPFSVIDTLNVNYRSVNRVTGGTPSSSSGVASNAFDSDFATACVTTSPNGFISYDFVTATQITTVGIRFSGQQYLKLKYQTSEDGTTWTDAYEVAPANRAVAQLYANDEWLWFDVPRAQARRYSRVLETSGGTLAVSELVFGNTPTEVPMARLNRDDYSNLPNKYFPGRPVQYWLDRQTEGCRLNTYPVADATSQYGHIIMYVKSMIMDSVDMDQDVDMPYRWYDALCYRMATELANELPEVREDMAINLEGKARSRELEAKTEDRDNSPVYFQPQIAVYTK